MRDYLKDPAAIYRESESRIQAEIDLASFPYALHPLVIRLAHAVGDTSFAKDLAWSSENVVAKAQAALTFGQPILCDGTMTVSGIIQQRLPMRNSVICTLNTIETSQLAQRLNTTRSAAAVDLWRPRIQDSVVAIGNAPTALFRLLEILTETPDRPAAIFAFPVGFVGAAESKDALIAAAEDLGLAFLTLRGRRGGSPLAAAAINGLFSPLSL